ncbi:MAG: THUMP domain-containing protein [Gemmataceae bacterium]
MARSRRTQPESAPEPPACYAMVHPGLEEVAADEIRRDLGGDVRKTSRGVVVFRLTTIDERILNLRTTEDVFLLAWGSDQLTYRATDLDLIQRWTARSPAWPRLLKIHHAVRPRPKGRPTYRLVAQMEGEHGYLRKHARERWPRAWPGTSRTAGPRRRRTPASRSGCRSTGQRRCAGCACPTGRCGTGTGSWSTGRRRCGRPSPPPWSASRRSNRGRSWWTRCAA